MKGSPELSAVLAAASATVARVAAGQSLAAHAPSGEGALRAATMDIVYGTLRRYGRGDALVDALSHRGIPDPAIRALLNCALYAIESGRYAPYVAVDQAVNACAALQLHAAKGFVNALLRRFLRERAALDARIAALPAAQWMHPQWWIDAVREAYPGEWQSVLTAGNTHPPMALRVNERRTTVEKYMQRLVDDGIEARRDGRAGVILAQPVSVDRLPGFAQGEVSVQDIGAQRAAEFLDVRDGQRVLDACAAPGGKTCHMLERAAIDLVALDSEAKRCLRIRENLQRLGLAAQVEAADCTRPEDWWDGRPFDRILADVPCTASGIARRHPDIKWLRRAGDPARFAAQQTRILEALWQVLAPGGKLLYVTCSVFPEENAGVAETFCARQPGARRLALPGGAPPQLLPGPDNDGFFFALLQK